MVRWVAVRVNLPTCGGHETAPPSSFYSYEKLYISHISSQTQKRNPAACIGSSRWRKCTNGKVQTDNLMEMMTNRGDTTNISQWLQESAFVGVSIMQSNMVDLSQRLEELVE